MSSLAVLLNCTSNQDIQTDQLGMCSIHVFKINVKWCGTFYCVCCVPVWQSRLSEFTDSHVSFCHSRQRQHQHFQSHFSLLQRCTVCPKIFQISTETTQKTHLTNKSEFHEPLHSYLYSYFYQNTLVSMHYFSTEVPHLMWIWDLKKPCYVKFALVGLQRVPC